jgi:hypothetical protein
VSDESQAVRYRYTGDGTTFLEGVPARDLTAQDWALLDDVQRAAVAASDLYEAAGGGKAKE